MKFLASFASVFWVLLPFVCVAGTDMCLESPRSVLRRTEAILVGEVRSATPCAPDEAGSDPRFPCCAELRVRVLTIVWGAPNSDEEVAVYLCAENREIVVAGEARVVRAEPETLREGDVFTGFFVRFRDGYRPTSCAYAVHRHTPGLVPDGSAVLTGFMGVWLGQLDCDAGVDLAVVEPAKLSALVEAFRAGDNED